MRTSSKIMMAAGALSMLLLFAFPMWKIYLDAPQYPEGLEMHIWVNKIGGGNEFTLQNFNILNHYIGMAPIEEDSFAELTWMPRITVFFIVTGLLLAFLNNRKLILTWGILLMAASITGLADFYLWLHEFGTNLDPHAPIKVPGMTYIPPFIGSKNLLNFEAFSMPYLGSLGIGIPIIVSLLVFLFERRKKQAAAEKNKERTTGYIPSAAAASFLLLLLAGCSAEPRPINYGSDQCHFCKMTVADKGWGSEMVTAKGKVYVFDSVECLARFAEMEEGDPGDRHFVTDYSSAGTLVEASSAHYLHSEELPSPMGENLTAFGTKEAAEKALTEKGGEILTWVQVKEKLK